MAQGVSGYVEFSGSGGFSLRVLYSEDYSVETNASTVKITELQVKSTQWYGFTYYLDGTIRIDGQTVVSMDSGQGGHSAYIPSMNVWTKVSGTMGTSGSIAHDTDGSKSVAVAVDVRGYTIGGGGGSGWRANGSKSVALTNIPRSSGIGATDANIGATSVIAISKKSAAYTHSIAYQFGSLTGYIDADGNPVGSEVKLSATNIPFKVPTTFYAQIPNAKSGICTLTCRTYSGSTLIGSPTTAAFTATASEAACAPTVTGTAVDSNPTTLALTGDANKLVRYYSAALLTISAAAKNSASIQAKTIDGTGVALDVNTRTISAVEKDTFSFSAVDSRGYSGSASVKKTLIPYVKLTCNVIASRPQPTDGSGRLQISGNYFNGSFGAQANALTLEYRPAGGDWVSLTPTVSGNAYSAQVNLTGLDYTQAFNFEIRVADKLASLTRQAAIGKGIPVFDWGEADFRFNVPVAFHSGVPVSGLADYVLEQGSSGIWVWRKWYSGIAECWGSATFTTAITDSWGSLYEAATVAAQPYPFAFAAEPQELVNVNGGVGKGIETAGRQTANHTATYFIFRPSEYPTRMEYVINFFVIGRWK
ncbi:MAG TPA: hypothetical protein IAC31_09230 [Candidatus Faecousia intestinigallinarum]|nr:hypothetical protein [Candidatus Faecousia intestinigallinarum]